MNRTTVIIGVVAIAAGGWYFFSHSGKDTSKELAAAIVSTAPVLKQDSPLDIHDVGNVVAYETVVIHSRLDSQVMEVAFKDGDAVKKGDLLFQLDDRALKAQANELAANLERDKAQLENLRLQYERSKALAAQGFAATSNLDAAKAAYLAQQATVAATQASLDNVRVQIGYTRITSPIDGRTGTISITTGNTVKANDTLALVTINQIKPIRVQISLAQQYFAPLRTAMQAGKVEVLAQQQGIQAVSHGTLEYIDNAVDQSSNSFVVRAVFDNDDEALWPGMFVNTTITLGVEKDTITIPEVAVQHGQNGDYVFVIDGDKAHKRDVKIGRIENGTAVIADGLKEGETVAIDGMLSLKDGVDVTINTSKKPTAAEKAEDAAIPDATPAEAAPAETPPETAAPDAPKTDAPKADDKPQTAPDTK